MPLQTADPTTASSTDDGLVPRLTPLRIAGLYLLFGLTLLFVSDVVFPWVIEDQTLLREAQAFKGAAEVLLSAILIFGLVRHGQRELAVKTRAMDEASVGISITDPAREDNPLVYVNDGFLDITGYPREEILGRNCRFLQGEDTDPETVAAIREAVDKRRPITTEILNYREDGTPFWNEVQITPVENESGKLTHFIGIQNDVTDRVERERDLERYEAVVETMQDGVYVADGESRIVRVNQAMVDMTGYTREELVGSHMSILADQENVDRAEEIQANLLESTESVWTIDGNLVTKADERIPTEVSIAAISLPDGETGRVGVVRDVTERKERERRLRESEQRYRTLIEMAPDPVVVHVDGEIRFANDAFLDVVGADDLDAVLGTDGSEYVVAEERDDATAMLRRIQQGGDESVTDEREIRTLDGEQRYVVTTSRAIEYEGESAVLTILRDQTEQRRYQEAVHSLHERTRAMLTADTEESIAETAVAAAEDLFGLPGATVFEFDEAQNALVALAQSPGVAEHLCDASTIAPEDGCPVWTAFERGEHLYTTGGEGEPPIPEESPVESLLCIPLGTHGLFATGTIDDDEIAETTIDLCSILAANVEAALDRIDREQRVRQRDEQLERQTEELEELQRLATTVQLVQEAIIDATTQEGLQREVCERLRGIDGCSCAWVGKLDETMSRVVPATDCGRSGGLSDEVRNAPASNQLVSVATRAIETGTLQSVPRILDDPSWESDREMALKYGFNSLLAIPIPLDGEPDRVLVVLASEPGFYPADGEDVYEKLGRMIGTAMTRIGTSDPQMAAATTQVELRIDDDRLVLNRWSELLGEPVTLEGAIPVEDGRFVAFVTTAAGADSVEELVDEDDQIESVKRLAEDETSNFYRLEGSMTPFFETLYRHDARLLEMRSTDGSTTAAVELQKQRSVREFVDDVSAAYPDTDLVARRTIESPAETTVSFRAAVRKACTDRQYQALQTAHHGGYYEWPRAATNEDLADALGISSPTYQAHRRAAERILVSMLFDDRDGAYSRRGVAATGDS